MSGPHERLYHQVSAISAEPVGRLTATTEIYKDLRVSGDDLWELLANLHNEFGTDFSEMKLTDFAPGEADYDWLPWPFDHRRKYRSLTIGALEGAVERGRWQENGE